MSFNIPNYPGPTPDGNDDFFSDLTWDDLPGAGPYTDPFHSDTSAKHPGSSSPGQPPYGAYAPTYAMPGPGQPRRKETVFERMRRTAVYKIGYTVLTTTLLTMPAYAGYREVVLGDDRPFIPAVIQDYSHALQALAQIAGLRPNERGRL